MVAVSRRRQPRDRDGRLRLGRGGALDPRQRHRDECRHRRRHLEDRGLRRRQGGRPHRGRRRRAARLRRRRRQDRAHRGSRPAFRRRARHQARDRRAAVAGGGARARRPHGRPAVRGHEGRRCRRSTARGCAGSIRSSPAAPSTRSRSPAACPNTSTAARRSPSAISACCWRRKSARALEGWGPKIEPSNEGIRATVIGASQYTTQVSRQHDLRLADGGAAAAQRAGDRADHAARRRGHRLRRGVRRRSRACCGGSISARATRRSRCSCRGAARRRSSGSTPSARARSTGSPTCWRRAIRSCSPATATSAACSASTCAKR